MAMQAWPPARGSPCQKERNAGAVVGALEPPGQLVLLDPSRGHRVEQHLHPVDGVEERCQRPDHQRQIRDRAIALTGRQQHAVAGFALELGGERQQRLVGTLEQVAGPRHGHDLGDRCEHRADPIAPFVVGDRAVEDRVRSELRDHRRRIACEKRVDQPAAC
jgi:hypothetical protein